MKVNLLKKIHDGFCINYFLILPKHARHLHMWWIGNGVGKLFLKVIYKIKFSEPKEARLD